MSDDAAGKSYKIFIDNLLGYYSGESLQYTLALHSRHRSLHAYHVQRSTRVSPAEESSENTSHNDTEIQSVSYLNI